MSLFMKIYSKDKKSLFNFLKFFNLLCGSTKKNYYLLKKKIQTISILKSPHINKSAQEQFESKIYLRVIKLSSVNFFQDFLILKRVTKNLFPLIKIKISVTDIKLTKQSETVNFNKINNIKSSDSIRSFLHLLDVAGHFKVKKILFTSLAQLDRATAF